MGLTGQQRKQLNEALLQAFPDEGELERLVSFGLNENLYALSHGNLTNRVFQLVRWAEAKGRLDELLLTACDHCPNHPALQAIIEQLQPAQFDWWDKEEGLEGIVYDTIKFAHAEHLFERFRKYTHTICRIEMPVGLPIGTGFLLGPDLLITNYHVLLPALGNPARSEQIVFRFNYKVEKEGNRLNNGREYSLATVDNWPETGSVTRDLDYILVRIKEKEKQGNDLEVNVSAGRLWLTPRRYIFTPGEPLFILQHPQGIPLQFASGSVTSLRLDRTRIYYTANTLNGSSGSPCLASDGSLVALHCRNDRANARNEGISFKAILEDLQQKGLSGLPGEQKL